MVARPSYHHGMPGLLHDRLRRQRLVGTTFTTPAEVVGWMGAVQAQEYAVAGWALALRARGLTSAAVEGALADGTIVRTHVLRPTWHFVAPGDLRWMLALTGPRIRRLMRSYDARLELTDRVYGRARDVVGRALEGGRTLTRVELGAALARARIVASGQRLAHLMMDAELAAVVCSGPQRGHQFTYALVDERVPSAPTLDRDEALAALAVRYFRSHGPATIRDFSWWSGLTIGDARRAVAAARLHGDVLATPPEAATKPGAHFLLPIYDEYVIAYRDRDVVLDPAYARNLGVVTPGTYPNALVLDGRVAGSWKRTVSAAGIDLAVRCHEPPTSAVRAAVARMATRYGRFAGAPARLLIEG